MVSPPQDRIVVQAILEQMDEIPKQVMIETLVVEANLDKAHQLGIEFSATQNNPFGGFHGTQTETQSYGLQANAAQPQGLRYTLAAGQYQVFLQAVQTDSRFNVLSTPRIFTTNNATAQINISQSLPYVTNQTVTTTGTILYNYNFLSVGIVLTVTPRITSNGYVTMDVTQTANDFVSYTSFNAPTARPSSWAASSTTPSRGPSAKSRFSAIFPSSATSSGLPARPTTKPSFLSS